jgi:hypothetical protein
MEEFRFSNHAGSNEIVSTLNEFGVAIIDDYFSLSEVNSLILEFEHAFVLAETAGTKRSILNGEYGLCPREMIDSHKQQIPQFSRFLHDINLME